MIINKKLYCDWCGFEDEGAQIGNWHRSHADDLCCPRCIDEANNRTLPLRSLEDIYRLNQEEATQMLMTIATSYLGNNFRLREGVSTRLEGLNNILIEIRKDSKA